MKKLAVIGITLAMSVPGLAQAGAYSVSQDQNVVIYRGEVPAVSSQTVRAHQARVQSEAKTKRLKAKIRAQKRALKAQQAKIAQLKHRIEHLEENAEKRRPRYGRSYYGNNRFFGRNGFIGNSNFNGGTIYVGRRRGN